MIETPTDDYRKAAQSLRQSVRLSDASDEELLLEYCSAQDGPAFTELVHRYERELYGYLRRFLGDAGMAEDTFQLTFLQVHLKCQQFQEGLKVRPWLYTIATNQAIDAQRRNRRHRVISLDRRSGASGDEIGKLLDLLVHQQPGPATYLEEEEQREWVRRAICDLPEQLRGVVNLVYFQGVKYSEAAEILTIPVGTVKSRMHSAILRLYEAWTQSHIDTESHQRS